jgi:co-chaperonin GroES (HSP10)
VKVGDVVIYKPFTGTEITHDNSKFLLIQDSDIIAKYVEVDAI